ESGAVIATSVAGGVRRGRGIGSRPVWLTAPPGGSGVQVAIPALPGGTRVAASASGSQPVWLTATLAAGYRSLSRCQARLYRAGGVVGRTGRFFWQQKQWARLLRGLTVPGRIGREKGGREKGKA